MAACGGVDNDPLLTSTLLSPNPAHLFIVRSQSPLVSLIFSQSTSAPSPPFPFILPTQPTGIATLGYTYNFGSPRVGNTEFANYVAAKIPTFNRVTHYNDIVPHVPYNWYVSCLLKLLIGMMTLAISRRLIKGPHPCTVSALLMHRHIDASSSESLVQPGI